MNISTIEHKRFRMVRISSEIIALIVASLLSFLMYTNVFIFYTERTYKAIAIILFFVSIHSFVYLFLVRKYRRRKKILSKPFSDSWLKILEKKVYYYNALSESEKQRFQCHVQLFIGETRITGIETDVDDECLVLTAVSAIIPVFNLPGWEYNNISEVLIYPSSFDENYQFDNQNGNILGMVHSGSVLILSKPDLYRGFEQFDDKQNVGIHEFVHLIDKADGTIDGVPDILLENPFAIPWIDLVQKKIEEIHELNSDINPYGGVGKHEFFPVVAEYFFERPKLLKQKHPELYLLLNDIFTIDLANKYKGKKLSN